MRRSLLLCLLISVVLSGEAVGLDAGSRLKGPSTGLGREPRPVRLASSFSHTCTVRPDGSVICWGDNSSGQLGDVVAGGRRAKPVYMRGVSGVVAVACGQSFTCVLRAGGTVACIGANNVGQLGNGTRTVSLVPVNVAGLTDVIEITAGSTQACALLRDGTVRCWGENR